MVSPWITRDTDDLWIILFIGLYFYTVLDECYRERRFFRSIIIFVRFFFPFTNVYSFIDYFLRQFDFNPFDPLYRSIRLKLDRREGFREMLFTLVIRKWSIVRRIKVEITFDLDVSKNRKNCTKRTKTENSVGKLRSLTSLKHDWATILLVSHFLGEPSNRINNYLLRFP